MSIERVMADVARTVKELGQCVISVFPDPEEGEQGFTYTVGLEKDTGYELVVMSLDPVVATHILNYVRLGVLAGETLAMDGLPDVRWCNAPVVFIEVDPVKVDQMLCVACAYHHRVPKALQMVWPDEAGFYPDDPRCNEQAVKLQPLLSGRLQ